LGFYKMRKGWTLIELIFIIIIIGLLAGIALPKLSATRDDAKLSTTVHNMSVCIMDISAHYIATGLDYNATMHPPACDINNTKCYDISYGQDGDLNVSINTTREPFCADIENVGGHLANEYHFGGNRIVK